MVSEGDKSFIGSGKSGKKYTIFPGTPVLGEPVVKIPVMSGKPIISRVTDVAVGDNVILAPTKSGRKIVINADGDADSTKPVSEDVDPCKSLKVGMLPGSSSTMLIEWVPGDNNDAIYLEVSTIRYSTNLNDPLHDEDVSFEVDITSWEMSPIYYFQWHYFTIWGMRDGRYSRKRLTARFLVPLDIMASKMTMRVTIVPEHMPENPDYTTGVSGGLRNGVQNLGWYANDIASTYGTMWLSWALYTQYRNMPALVVDSDWTTGGLYVHDSHAGEAVAAQFPWQFGVDHTNFNYSPIMPHVGDAGYTFPVLWLPQVGPLATTEALVDAAIDVCGSLTVCLWFAKDVGIEPPYSWDIIGGNELPPSGEFYSGSYVIKRNQGGYHGYQSGSDWSGYFYATDGVIFDDGSYNILNPYSQGYIMYKLVDPDNGVFEIWAKCSGRWTPTRGWIEKNRDQELYFGNIKLCNNFDFKHDPTYHGFLGIQALDI